MQINLSRQQKEMTQQVRDVLTELLACASSANIPAEKIDVLITDAGISDELAQEIRDFGIELVIAPK